MTKYPKMLMTTRQKTESWKKLQKNRTRIIQQGRGKMRIRTAARCRRQVTHRIRMPIHPRAMTNNSRPRSLRKIMLPRKRPQERMHPNLLREAIRSQIFPLLPTAAQTMWRLRKERRLKRSRYFTSTKISAARQKTVNRGNLSSRTQTKKSLL